MHTFICSALAAPAGTPIGDRGLDDLLGLMRFLQVPAWTSSDDGASGSWWWWHLVVQSGCEDGEGTAAPQLHGPRLCALLVALQALRCRRRAAMPSCCHCCCRRLAPAAAPAVAGGRRPAVAQQQGVCCTRDGPAAAAPARDHAAPVRHRAHLVQQVCCPHCQASMHVHAGIAACTATRAALHAHMLASLLLCADRSRCCCRSNLVLDPLLLLLRARIACRRMHHENAAKARKVLQDALTARMAPHGAARGSTAYEAAASTVSAALAAVADGRQPGSSVPAPLLAALDASLVPSEQKKLLVELVRLRQACCHPQVRMCLSAAVRGSAISSAGAVRRCYQPGGHARCWRISGLGA